MRTASSVIRLSLGETASETQFKGHRQGPDGPWGWFVVFNSFLCNMIVDGMQYTFANFLAPMTKTFGASVPEISLIGSLLSGFYNFSGPIAGALGNKFGFRMVVITGSLIASMGLMVSYFAPNVHFLYFFYGILGGLGFGMIYMASVITTSVYFDKYRALAASISVCGTGVGTFVFAPLGDFLVANCGWRWALVAEGGIVLICALCGLSFKPVEFLKVVRLSAESSEISIGTSASYFLERRKTLPNEAYPTFQEAISRQGDRRSTVVSLVPKSERPSFNIAEGAVGLPSLNIRDVGQSSDEDIASSVTKADKCKKCLQVCCFRFWHCRCKIRELNLGDRPMYRDDVFLDRNISNRKFSQAERIKYHLSVMRVPDPREVHEHLRQKCCVCHHAFLRTCVTMTGLNLFKSNIFVFLCISSFLYTMGLYVPYVFILELSNECRVVKSSGIWMVSAIGISNTAGRLVSGIIKSFTDTNAAIFVLSCLFVSGLIAFIYLFCCTLVCLIIFSCIFGFFTAPFISLRPVIIVDFLGLEKLTNAFGLVLLSQGVASIIGPPIAGVIVSSVKSYKNVMYLSGALMILSGFALLTSILLNWKNKR